jgi:hypothetical protein
MPTITAVKVHPALGDVRLGSSRTGFIIGREKPRPQTRPTRAYQDSLGVLAREGSTGPGGGGVGGRGEC